MLKFKDVCILDIIDQWADVFPERVAVKSGTNQITWRDLIKQANILANYFTSLQGGTKLPIIFYGHKEIEMIIGFLASVKSGRCYIPIDDSTPIERLNFIKQTSNAQVIYTPQDIHRILLVHKDDGIDKNNYLNRDEDLFYIIYTSGSTGEPKGVQITFKNLKNFLQWVECEHRFSDHHHIFLNQAPFSFDLSVMDVFSSLLSGGTLHCINKTEIKNFKLLYKNLTNSEVTIWVSTPSFVRLCCVAKEFNETMLPSLTKFWFCGEILPHDLAMQLRNRFPKAKIYNTYGPTECTVAVTSIEITDNILKNYLVLPVGRTMTNCNISIIDDEVVISGDSVSKGYINNIALTNMFFDTKKQIYKTGDIGYIQDEILFIRGRKDRQIKLNGFRIELEEIEVNFRKLANILDVIIKPRYVNSDVVDLIAYVVPRDFSIANELDIKKQLKCSLPHYMIPRTICILRDLPLNNNGKADVKCLPNM